MDPTLLKVDNFTLFASFKLKPKAKNSIPMFAFSNANKFNTHFNLQFPDFRN